jgi:hypothetical protein
MRIASRRAFVGLGAGVLAAALSASARGATPPGSIKRFWRRKLESRFHIGILHGAVHHGEVSFIEKG